VSGFFFSKRIEGNGIDSRVELILFEVGGVGNAGVRGLFGLLEIEGCEDCMRLRGN
jgi:hypothetical protein